MKQRMFALLLIILCVFGASAQAADPMKGKAVYGVHCKNCHGQTGVSFFPGTPDFSKGEQLMKADSALMLTIQKGQGMMPAYKGVLTDSEILDVIAHIRSFR